MSKRDLYSLLERIANALERMVPEPITIPDLTSADAFVWHSDPERLEAVPQVNKVELNLLRGIQQQTDILYANTVNFSKGLPANNALLWGARGTGKSSLIKAIHGDINEKYRYNLTLVEIHREDIHTLPRLLSVLKVLETMYLEKLAQYYSIRLLEMFFLQSYTEKQLLTLHHYLMLD